MQSKLCIKCGKKEAITWDGWCKDCQDAAVANCPHLPELETQLGMYHCPDCGEMVIGGFPHPKESLLS